MPADDECVKMQMENFDGKGEKGADRERGYSVRAAHFNFLSFSCVLFSGNADVNPARQHSSNNSNNNETNNELP